MNSITQEAIAQVVRGIKTQTAVFLNATYIKIAQVSIFTVIGRVRLLYLGIEAITTWSADATTIKFGYDASTPAVGAVDLCTASGALTSLAVGKRVAVLGDALGTGALEAANTGVSLKTNAVDIGSENGVGVIYVTGAAAAQSGATASSIITCLWIPQSDNAYVESLI